MQVYKRLLKYVKSLWWIFILSVIGSIMYAAADSYSIYLLKPILDKGFSSQDIRFLEMLPIILMCVLTIRCIGSFISGYFLSMFGMNVVCKFRKQIFSKMLYLPADYYDKRNSGTMISKILYNVDQITGAMGNSIRVLFQDGGLTIGLVIVLFYINWKISLFILIIGPVLGFGVSKLNKRFRKLNRRTQQSMSDVTHITNESINNYKDIRIFNGQEKQKRLFFASVDKTYKQQMKVSFMDALTSPVVQIVLGIFVSCILAFVIYHMGKDIPSAGSFVAYISATLALLKPVKNLTQINSSIQKAISASEEIFEILDEEEESDRGDLTLYKPKEVISLQNISFGYQGSNKEVIKSVSFDIPVGKKIALVGSSGGGKSTILDLLMRFYSVDTGKIIINGKNIYSYKLNSYRENISYVSQQVCLFDDTLYNNIAYGTNKVVNQEQIINAAKKANAWDFISQLPEGLDTMIGENGMNLSGGQRQRIAIARAILKDAPILILDEATSALDNHSEKQVQIALESLMKDKTSIVIAHRLSTVADADNIVVISEGQVVEQGDHDSLLAEKGMYAALYQQSLH